MNNHDEVADDDAVPYPDNYRPSRVHRFWLSLRHRITTYFFGDIEYKPKHRMHSVEKSLWLLVGVTIVAFVVALILLLSNTTCPSPPRSYVAFTIGDVVVESALDNPIDQSVARNGYPTRETNVSIVGFRVDAPVRLYPTVCHVSPATRLLEVGVYQERGVIQGVIAEILDSPGTYSIDSYDPSCNGGVIMADPRWFG